MIGRFTTAHATIAANVVLAQSRVLPALRQSTSSGPSRNSGYSFAAPPRPSRTPARTGFFRAHASRPVAANAVASVSKFVNAWTSSSGEAAIRAASHGRSRAVRTTAQTVTSQGSGSQNAEMSKNTVTGSPVGSQPDAATESQPSVSFALKIGRAHV